ncbi:diacylglycerol kinase family protein [Halorubellus sp. PRR65]|uniref:diacylglycerol/lipid kinase family protein n=1 Tax=Halorubellus sp. PRR65 TaxID=3098148 RepID=UPI002B256752|nr:diacylglycerol kinase family protein [Halorubellus sp. PRR65]
MYQGSRRAVVNPVSGSGDHADYVERLLAGRGFDVERTEGAGDAVAFGRRAVADGVSEVCVCGGDGTINEVVRGLADAGGLGDVTLSVVPVGTANLLAGNVGVADVRSGVEIADTGEVRSVDVGFADDEPFLVSTIAGFPADASLSASSDLKARLGPLAFVVTGAQEAFEWDGLDIELEAVTGSGTERWTGDALCLLVGNARRFVAEGGQGDMEDGVFDVAVVEQMPATNVVAEALGQRLLGQDTPGVTHLQASDLHVTANQAIRFSRDGELAEHDGLDLSVRERALDLRVGDAYDPDPV